MHPFLYNMMSSWHGNAFCITDPLCLHKMPEMWSFDVLVTVALNKLLSKQLSIWWFEMTWCSCAITIMNIFLSQVCKLICTPVQLHRNYIDMLTPIFFFQHTPHLLSSDKPWSDKPLRYADVFIHTTKKMQMTNWSPMVEFLKYVLVSNILSPSYGVLCNLLSSH